MLKHVLPSDPSHCAPEKKERMAGGGELTDMNDCFVTFHSNVDIKEYHCHTSK